MATTHAQQPRPDVEVKGLVVDNVTVVPASKAGPAGEVVPVLLIQFTNSAPGAGTLPGLIFIGGAAAMEALAELFYRATAQAISAAAQ